jgi:copper resistance protein C
MRARVRIAAFLFVLVGELLFVGSASAHAKYQRSEPGDGALVSTLPARVDIWFAQELFRRQGDNRILVFDPAGQPVQVGEVQIDNDDRKHMWVLLPSTLKAGKYRVDWNNLSAEDGDPDQGSFSFTFDPKAVAIASTLNVATPSYQPTPSPVASASLTVPSPTSPASGGGSCLAGMLPVGILFGSSMALSRRRSGPL